MNLLSIQLIVHYPTLVLYYYASIQMYTKIQRIYMSIRVGKTAAPSSKNRGQSKKTVVKPWTLETAGGESPIRIK